jgi:phosphatidylethanolamine/phosphatidyl-N-methylethanolamine N-methyltransferase
MSLFSRSENSEEEFLGSSDAASRALSVTAVETDFVEAVYKRFASFYDVFFGLSLHPGRLTAVRRMGIKRGDRILEVGVGTGMNISLYPPSCQVTAIDLSASMLDKARDRVARLGAHHVELLQMDAAALKFPDNSFDIVYAPHFINCVPDPIQVTAEMRRVCRPGGRFIFLNHFRSENPVFSFLERAISPLTVHIGFKSDFDLPAFLAQADLQPESIEKVNIPRVVTLVTCVKE